MRLILASAFLLLAATIPAVPKSPEAQCNGRCSVDYNFCLKRTTTAKGRAECKLEHKACGRSCKTKLPAHH